MALSICRSRWVKGSDSSTTDSTDSVNQPLKPSPNSHRGTGPRQTDDALTTGKSN